MDLTAKNQTKYNVLCMDFWLQKLDLILCMGFWLQIQTKYCVLISDWRAKQVKFNLVDTVNRKLLLVQYGGVFQWLLSIREQSALARLQAGCLRRLTFSSGGKFQ